MIITNTTTPSPAVERLTEQTLHHLKAQMFDMTQAQVRAIERARDAAMKSAGEDGHAYIALLWAAAIRIEESRP